MNAIATNAPLHTPMALDLKLPWETDPQQEQQYLRLMRWVCYPLLAFLLVMPWLPVLQPEVAPVEETLTAKIKLVSQVVEEPREKPQPKPIVEAAPQQPVAPVEQPARPTIDQQAFAEVASQLSALRNSVNVAKLSNKNVFVSKTGSERQSERTTLGRETVLQQSGGIEVDDIEITSTGNNLSDYEGVVVDSPVVQVDLPASRKARYSSDINSRRDMENIRQVFERYKGSIYSIYTQALRQSPELSGKFLFQLVIEPDGSITDLKLMNSDLGNSNLEQRILAKINTIRFGAKDVPATAVQYKFVFLPN